jgi:hypothetical protein
MGTSSFYQRREEMTLKLSFIVSAALACMFVYMLSAQAASPTPQSMILQPTQVDLSQPPAPGKSRAPVPLSRHFANPALLGQVKAALAAANTSSPQSSGVHGKPSPSPSPAPSPTPSPAPISTGAAANPVPTPTSFDAISLLDTAGYVPPDTTLGAGAAYVVEAVNSQAEVYGKDGSAITLLNTAACTTNPSNDTISDPRVLYDATDGRWFISTMTFSPIGDASWNLLISTGSDPTVTTWECLIIPTSKIRNPDGSIGNFPDFPKIGMNSDKVVLTGDAFSPSVHGRSQSYKFQGTEFIVINKIDLLSWSPGLTVHTALFAPNMGDFAIEPAQQLGTSTTTLYMAAVNSAVSSTSTIDVWAITGIPGVSTVSAPFKSQSIASISYPPNAQQEGTSVLLDTNDDSLLDAVYRDGSLWVSANDACVPGAPGDSTVRSCLRFINVTVDPTSGAMSVAQDFDYGDPGTYYYFPAIRTDSAGNLLAAFTGSSSSSYASAYAGMQASGTPNELTNLSVTRAGDFSYTISPPRWGDYSGAAVDPIDGSVWLGAEYATGVNVLGLSDPWWGTAIAHVSP